MIPPRIISILPSQRIAASSLSPCFCNTSSTIMRRISSASSSSRPLQMMISTSSSTFPCCCFMRTAAATTMMQALPSSTTTTSPGGFTVQFFDRLFQQQQQQQQQSPFSASILPMLTFYLVVTNILYLARRSYLRKMSIQKLWKIRTTREPGVTLQLYFIILIAWQAFVLTFPIVEPLARSLGHVSFFYSYPNASGVGIIFEPRNVQNLKQSQRAKHQIRLDWHRFSVNIGSIGRDGFRHPPSIERNLPHVDIPKRGVKHWPWRRRRKSGGITTK